MVIGIIKMVNELEGKIEDYPVFDREAFRKKTIIGAILDAFRKIRIRCE